VDERFADLVLRRNDGGVWRLDTRPRDWAFIGCRVRLTGTRVDFDLLNVHTIETL
jgi:hypothetical protein